MIVAVCFEVNGVDTPILRGVKTYGRAMAWRNQDYAQRYFVLYTVDHDPDIPREPASMAALRARQAQPHE